MSEAEESQRPVLKGRRLIPILQVIQLAFLLSCFVYGLVGLFVLKDAAGDEGLANRNLIIGIFAFVALSGIGLALMARKFFVRIPLERGSLDLDQKEHAARYFTANIFALALAEAPAVFGLVLRFMGESKTVLVGFVIASIVALSLLSPKRDLELSENRNPFLQGGAR